MGAAGRRFIQVGAGVSLSRGMEVDMISTDGEEVESGEAAVGASGVQAISIHTNRIRKILFTCSSWDYTPENGKVQQQGGMQEMMF